MDSKFSIGPIRFGLDSIIGLIPGVGDSVGAALSSYIIFKAWSLNVSGATLGRMVLNTAIDSIVGAIPIVGDLFDVAWKANTKNLALLEKEMRSPKKARRKSYLWLLIVLISVAGLLYLCIYLPLSILADHCC